MGLNIVNQIILIIHLPAQDVPFSSSHVSLLHGERQAVRQERYSALILFPFYIDTLTSICHANRELGIGLGRKVIVLYHFCLKCSAAPLLIQPNRI